MKRLRGPARFPTVAPLPDRLLELLDLDDVMVDSRGRGVINRTQARQLDRLIAERAAELRRLRPADQWRTNDLATVERAERLLRDRPLMEVAELTGLAPGTVLKIREGRHEKQIQRAAYRRCPSCGASLTGPEACLACQPHQSGPDPAAAL